MSLAARIREEVSLAEEAGRVVTWDARKSLPAKGEFWACCPLHGEATPSFHVTEPGGTGGRFYCFGCQAGGSVIDFVMAMEWLDAGGAIRRLARPEWRAESDADRDARDARNTAAREKATRAQDEKAAAGLAHARAIWAATVPGHDVLGAYLEGRGIRLGPLGGVPPALRLHPDLACYAPDGRGVIHRGPAMVGRVGRVDAYGVHMTWIDGAARARADGAKVPKKMRGATGGMLGAPVVLSPPLACRESATLLVGEGIETTLAVLGALRLWPGAAMIGAEAALSLPALVGRADGSGWHPPGGVARVILLADPSSRAPDRARASAARAAARLSRPGLAVEVRVPRGRWDHDDDFADLAQNGELFKGE